MKARLAIAFLIFWPVALLLLQGWLTTTLGETPALLLFSVPPCALMLYIGIRAAQQADRDQSARSGDE